MITSSENIYFWLIIMLLKYQSRISRNRAFLIKTSEKWLYDNVICSYLPTCLYLYSSYFVFSVIYGSTIYPNCFHIPILTTLLYHQLYRLYPNGCVSVYYLWVLQSVLEGHDMNMCICKCVLHTVVYLTWGYHTPSWLYSAVYCTWILI